MVVMAIFAILLIVGSVLFPVYLERLINDGGDWSIALLIIIVFWRWHTEFIGVSAATRTYPSLHANLMDLEIIDGHRLSIGR